ncbi:methanol utilization protein MoxY [Candidatus Methylospira mobilis]|uniref:Oxygen sensor histidine kinase NreB n=1 Tax=Candidatus Methylospira mobilis TaxID=1808979 RepID=A0A5Q0BRJ6_9GAMM|nr:ATP-binding protein [Candidatus Methylospira mobilis]QFY44697.1 methanol utilization protein MoxY [Candidatus Methylospira mobilis]WNV05762.1 histidine kinase [Candidatus Methylospira mobilis]
MSLRFRLNLTISLTMFIIVSVGALFITHNARRSVLEEVRSSVNMALQLIDAGLQQTGGDEARLRAWLSELAHLENTRHLRIHVQQLPEKIIKLDSPPRDKAENPVPSWFAWAVTPELMTGEKMVESSGGNPIRISVEADPSDEIAEAWREAEDFLYLMIILAAAVYAVVHFTLGRAFVSVGVILQGLEGIEQGNYEKRLPHLDLLEFDRISQAFNHTAEALTRSRRENRALTQQSLAIQEEERRYISQELHDEFGQSLSAVKVMAASLKKRVDDDGLMAVEAIIESCDHMFIEVRAMMRRLRPMLLDELGLRASLEDLIAHWRNRNQRVEVDFHYDDEVEQYAGDAKIHLFRIVQECLTNIVKYAGARQVSIDFRLSARTPLHSIILDISDDGKGFNPEQTRSGFGLLGMKERIASLGGEFDLTTRPGGGVAITVRVPCPREPG